MILLLWLSAVDFRPVIEIRFLISPFPQENAKTIHFVSLGPYVLARPQCRS